MRHLTDAQGREWRIYERTTGEDSPVAGRCPESRCVTAARSAAIGTP